VPTDRNTGFNEPLSAERNTTLPFPGSEEAPAKLAEENLKAVPEEHEHVRIGAKIKGEIKSLKARSCINQNCSDGKGYQTWHTNGEVELMKEIQLHYQLPTKLNL